MIRKYLVVFLAIYIVLFFAANAAADKPIPGHAQEYMKGKLLFGVLILSIFLTLTVCIELVVALIYSLLRRLGKRKVLLAVFIANAVSYPLFFIVNVALGAKSGLSLIPSEVFVILLECAIINRFSELDLKESAVLSLLINMASFVLPFNLSA